MGGGDEVNTVSNFTNWCDCVHKKLAAEWMGERQDKHAISQSAAN
jgi:hypothetical protein